MKSRLCLVSFLLCSSISLYAQGSLYVPKPAPVTDEIVVTASAIPEPLETIPASVTVITRAGIEASGARDLADVLREVPGLTISRTGSSGKATSLFTRGASSTHTLVMWNGIPITNPYFAGYDWGRFSSAGVEQVEVVRGPYSALYGSDAVAGVVNVLTTPSHSELSAEVESGGNGLRNEAVTGSWVNRSSVVTAAFEHRRDDGFADNDDFRQNSGSFLWKWTSGNHISLGLAARQTSYELGIPFDLSADLKSLVPTPSRRQKGNERQISIPFGQRLGGFSYDLTLAESRRADDFADPHDVFGLVSSTTHSTTRRARLTGQATTLLGTIVAGGELQRENVSDDTNFGPNLTHDRRRATSFFVEDRLSQPVGDSSRFELSAGARWDRFDTFGSQTSPRLAVGLIHGPRKFRAAYGEGFRAPAVGELYYPFAGNRDLRAERSRSFEVGYDEKTGNRLFSITAFRGRYRDLIVFDNTTFVFQNQRRAKTQGIELGIEEPFAAGSYGRMSYTFLQQAENENGERLARRPRHSGSMSLGHRAGNVDANLTLVYAGQRNDVLPVTPFTTVGNSAYTTIDLKLEQHLGRFRPFVKLENATDKRYEEVRGYPSPSRRLVFGARIRS